MAGRVAVSAAYCFGCLVLILTAGARVSGASSTVTAGWAAVGLVTCLAALLADRLRRRRFHPPRGQQLAVTDRRTVRQLRIQRCLALGGGLLAVALMYVGDREVDAGRVEIAELRDTGVATVGRVVDRKPERWWVKHDDDEVTIAYRRVGANVEYRVTYDVASLDPFPIGKEVEVIYDPRSGRAVVDGRGIGVGEGPLGFVGTVGGIGVAAVVAYQLNSIRRVSRIIRHYPWVSERVDTTERQSEGLWFTRMYVSVGMPNGPDGVLLRLAHGLRFRRRMIHEGTTLRLAGNPLDDVVIDVPKSRLLVPAGPAVLISDQGDQSGVKRVDRRRRSRRKRQSFTPCLSG
jgi:hypothetical protein